MRGWRHEGGACPHTDVGVDGPENSDPTGKPTNLGGLFGELRGERQTNLNVAPPSATFSDMSGSYTDEELRDLARLPKRVTNPGARWSEKPTEQPVHRQRMFRATASSDDGRDFHFQIYQRQNLLDAANYSCGIAYLPASGPRLTLARYNGSNHEHGPIRYRPHIHGATETAITAGRKPESDAQATTRYETLEGALACLIEDFSLSNLWAEPDHPSLFHGDPT